MTEPNNPEAARTLHRPKDYIEKSCGDMQSARCTLNDETDPRYAIVFDLVADLPVLAPETIKEFNAFCTERNRRAVQSAALQLVGTGALNCVLQVLARELDLSISERARPYMVEFSISKDFRGPITTQVHWRPAEKLLFQRSMDKIEWLMTTNIPHICGVDWDELARDQIKYEKTLVDGARRPVEECRERMRTHCALIQRAARDAGADKYTHGETRVNGGSADDVSILYRLLPDGPSDEQKSIFIELHGQQIRAALLQKRLTIKQRKFFHEMKLLREKGLVRHKRREGYFRPDAPPTSAV